VASLAIYWYPRQVPGPGRRGHRRAQGDGAGEQKVTRRPVLLKMGDPGKVEAWRRAICRLLPHGAPPGTEPAATLPDTTKPILFLINPKSGSGKALNVFNSQVGRYRTDSTTGDSTSGGHSPLLSPR
jgi:hypothetical protein